MAGVGCFLQSYKLILPTVASFHGVQCCSGGHTNRKKEQYQTPKFLKSAVNGVTELLRLFSPADQDRVDVVNKQIDDSTVSDVDDILMIIKSDYENAYFVTGLFTSAIYADDCTFEDPTIKFQGRNLYSSNLKLLLPFFDNPSIFLKSIEKVSNSNSENIVASWRLRTHLKLPWKPLVLIDGTTAYEIDDQLKVIRHVESWDISSLEAIGQIFTPGFMSSSR